MSNRLKILLVFLIIVTIGTGFYSNRLNKESGKITEIKAHELETPEQNRFVATIYFPNLKENKLNSTDVTFEYNTFSKIEIIKSTVDILFSKLKELNILTKERFEYEIYIRNRTVYLDLDSKVLRSSKTPQEELLLIYSFTDTILSLGGADTLVFLIDGHPADKVNFIKLNKSYKMNKEI